VSLGTEVARPGLRSPSMGLAVGTFVVAAGWAIGLRPLADNSFFTHLATGRLILDTGAVPSVDPYTFTAPGQRWLVQSWLASVVYATVESVGGLAAVRLLMGVVAAGLTALAWRLTRPAEAVLPRLAIAAVFVTVSAELWAERPLMLGLLAFGGVLLAADGQLDPRWLVPLGWGWVNVHGSFPLGLVYLVVVAAGRRLDRHEASVELRALRWLALGVVLGAIGPLGPAVLAFPVELLQRQDVLRNVIEWRAPTFDSLSQRAFLVQLALAVLALIRRPSYRGGLVVVVFTLAALLGSRNLSVASLVLLPVLASAAPTWGSLRSQARTSFSRIIGVAAVAAVLLIGAARFDQPNIELRGYPVDALAYLEEHEIDLEAHKMATKDIVGNLLELVYGPSRVVFYDDRFDMFPKEVSDAHVGLVQGGTSLRSDLAQFDVEIVTIDRTGAVGQRFVVDPDWRVLYTDERWLVACRRELELGGRVGRC